MMRKVSLLFVLILIVMLSAASTQAQGISAILERLDSLEQRIDGLGTSLEDIQSNDPGSSEAPAAACAPYGIRNDFHILTNQGTVEQ